MRNRLRQAVTVSETPDRLVPLTGTFNLRDTGGYRAADGTTKWGKLYRSDSLHRLSDEDQRELARRGIRLVIDLRGEDEREFAPSRLDAVGAEVVHNPVLAAPTSTFIQADASLAEFYDDIVDRSGPSLIAAVRLIAGSGETPVLVHCTAGKDRTGLVVAFALSLAGVDREDVLRDYAETEKNLPAPLLDQIVERLRATVAPQALHLDELVRLSPVAALERVFERIEGRWGSLEAYALENGLTESDLERLRAALVSPR